jgi:hypothetical protein
MFWPPESFAPQPYYKQVTFYTDLSKDVCRKKLEDTMALDDNWVWFNPREFCGKLNQDDSFRLRRNFKGRNSWYVTFQGIFIPDGTRTRIEGNFSTLLFVETFTSCWVISIALAGLLIFFGQTVKFLQVLTEQKTDLVSAVSNYLWSAFSPIFMFLFGRAMQLAGRRSAVYGERELTLFLRKTLNAKRDFSGKPTNTPSNSPSETPSSKKHDPDYPYNPW